VQVLKAGLRLIDERWGLLGKGLGDLADGMLRSSLFRDLLSGKIRLQSVTGNDVSAAQHDIKKLTLVQLLRLRTLHLDFTPSGCGADTITGVGGTHEAFLTTLDGLLFQQLGHKAVNPGSENGQAAAARFKSTSDAHQCGREAVMFVAAAEAAPSPIWWSWWLPEGVDVATAESGGAPRVQNRQRVFFNAQLFASSGKFSDGGVFEVSDFSKPDRHDPSGRLRWMDWKLNVVTEEGDLSQEPRADIVVLEATSPVSPSREAAANAKNKDDTEPAAAGGNTAGLVNAETLRNLRGGLRKTGTLERLGQQ